MDDLALAKPRLALLLDHFSELQDARQSWRVAYPLREVLFLVVCATWLLAAVFGPRPILTRVRPVMRLDHRSGVPSLPLGRRRDEPDNDDRGGGLASGGADRSSADRGGGPVGSSRGRGAGRHRLSREVFRGFVADERAGHDPEVAGVRLRQGRAGPRPGRLVRQRADRRRAARREERHPGRDPEANPGRRS